MKRPGCEADAGTRSGDGLLLRRGCRGGGRIPQIGWTSQRSRDCGALLFPNDLYAMGTAMGRSESETNPRSRRELRTGVAGRRHGRPTVAMPRIGQSPRSGEVAGPSFSSSSLSLRAHSMFDPEAIARNRKWRAGRSATRSCCSNDRCARPRPSTTTSGPGSRRGSKRRSTTRSHTQKRGPSSRSSSSRASCIPSPCVGSPPGRSTMKQPTANPSISRSAGTAAGRARVLMGEACADTADCYAVDQGLSGIRARTHPPTHPLSKRPRGPESARHRGHAADRRDHDGINFGLLALDGS